MTRREDGRLYLILPRDLSDEIAALAAFRDVSMARIIQDFVKIGLLVAKNDDIVLCRKDGGEFTGDYEEIDLNEGDEL